MINFDNCGTTKRWLNNLDKKLPKYLILTTKLRLKNTKVYGQISV